MKTALICAICLCVTLLLAACGATKQPLIRTEIVEVPVIRYRPLPATLTESLPRPATPPRSCKHRDGRPAVCALDGLLQIMDWQSVTDRADEDRATSANLTSRDAGETP